MGAYIDRSQALCHPFANGKYDHEHANEHFILGFESYREWLEELPTIDLVRCGECKYREKNHYCVKWGQPYLCKDEAFCSYGERKGEAMIIQLKPTNEATLYAVNIIISFLESGHYGCSFWKDENGQGFAADMGYLFEGLEEIKKYCKGESR